MMIDEKRLKLVEHMNETFNRMIDLFLVNSKIGSNPRYLSRIIDLCKYHNELILLCVEGFEYDTSPRYKELVKKSNSIQEELMLVTFQEKFDIITESKKNQ